MLNVFELEIQPAWLEHPACRLAVRLGREDRFVPEHQIARDAEAIASLAAKIDKSKKSLTRTAAWRKLVKLVSPYGAKPVAGGGFILLKFPEGHFASRAGLLFRLA